MLFIPQLIKLIFGSRNQRMIKRYTKTVAKINALENHFAQLSDDALGAKTIEFKQRLAHGATLDEILPEAFAVVREASKRTLGLRHFDVQLIGGMTLHEGKIAEMCTGEGKTLVSTLPAYLNALTGKGLHIVTVNDYLAKRDAEWMGPIYQFLGLTVGVALPNIGHEAKKAAYAADITYGTNNEFGFDYLRDNMVFTLEDKVQRDLHYAIVDEVDSILIDEARTPLVISGPTNENSDLYAQIDQLIPKLTLRTTNEGAGDYYLEEKHKQAYLTEEGHHTIEKLMIQAGLIKAGESLYESNNIKLMHYIGAALRAHKNYQKDIDYIVMNGEVLIVDEHTGRTMPGRRWSDGLHQAIEAKEKVKIQNENQTLATITLQNYFRLFDKLSGMTGTADTEAYELQQIYGLEVVVIPTNKPLIRKDHVDRVYLTAREKYNAIIIDIKDCVARQQPALVGTASIENSEYLSKILQQEKIPHAVLNAKFHEKEAQIIAQAGQPGAITIATNMAGRGTDIVLGGNLSIELSALVDPTEEQIATVKSNWQKRHDAVVKAGGLHVIGTERHESRRIDNQLRGRSGRQGDPGSSRFYVSLQDNLMRIFASERVTGIMQRFGVQEGEAIEHSWVSKAIESAQKKVESFHFDVRKQLLEYDDIANDQRKVIYQQRNELMALNDISEAIKSIRSSVADSIIEQYVPPHSMEEQWDIAGLQRKLTTEFDLNLSLTQMIDEQTELNEEKLHELIKQKLAEAYQHKELKVGSETMRHFEKVVMMNVLDAHWKEHLALMDHLRQSIHLSGYAQKDPKQEYKRESFTLFASMLDNIKREVIRTICVARVERPDVEQMEEKLKGSVDKQTMYYHHDDPNKVAVAEEQIVLAPQSEKVVAVKRDGTKVGRNDPCPCGSGKKYKQCHGKL